MSTLRIGLNLSKNSNSSSRPAPAKRKPIFGDEDDDDDPTGQDDSKHSLPKNSKSSSRPSSKHEKNKTEFEEIAIFDEDSPTSNAVQNLPPSPKPAATSSSSSKPTLKPKFSSRQHFESSPNLSTLRSHTLQTADVDPSLYDYDAAHDAFHSQAARSKAAGSGSGAANVSADTGYMNDLLAAAEQRKKDQLRAKERLLQKEREAEGDEFQDKDTFVTEAYKAQQEEQRKADEQEKQQEEKQNQRRQQGLGMTNFYKGMMADREKQHQELVDAAANSSKAQAPAQDKTDKETPKEKSDLELARDLKAKGKQVDINEEGQVLDKRQLLTAGLNVAPKPKQAGKDPKGQAQNAAHRDDRANLSSQARGDPRRAQRERQSRMMEEQLEQAAKRAAEDEAAEQDKLEKAAKTSKTDSDISSAKERYLQRKREAAAAAAEANK